MSAARTPSPWLFKPQEHDDWGFIRSIDGYLVAIARPGKWLTVEEEDEFRRRHADPTAPNAEFIVRACNNFDALVEALDDILASYSLTLFSADTEPTIVAARAALAAARGEAASAIEHERARQ